MKMQHKLILASLGVIVSSFFTLLNYQSIYKSVLGFIIIYLLAMYIIINIPDLEEKK